VRTLAIAGVLALAGFGIYEAAFAEGAPAGRTIDYWVAAVPVVWNIAPNGHDAIMGTMVSRPDTVRGTVVYRRYSPHWRKPEPNAPRSSSDGLLIPGPLIQARVGDQLRIHFKNMDTLRREPHSMHFHGVHYEPSSDGAYVPGFSGEDAMVRPGHTYTYVLNAGDDSAGVWPYHDHSPSMMDSIEGGMYGMLSILGRHERAPDREFEVVLAPMGKFMTIDGRAFVGNTPIFRAKVGELVKMAKDAGFTPQAVPIKLLFPLLEGASLEEDEDLHTLWAALLANAASPENEERVRPAFIATLRQLSRDEAELLNWVYTRATNGMPEQDLFQPIHETEMLEAYAGLGLGGGRGNGDGARSITAAVNWLFGSCLGTLEAEQLIRTRFDIIKVGERNTFYSLTYRGFQFVTACRPPKPKS